MILAMRFFAPKVQPVGNWPCLMRRGLSTLKYLNLLDPNSPFLNNKNPLVETVKVNTNDSTIPNMNTFHSTEIGPKIDKLDGIKSWYEELDLDATDGPDAWRRHDLVYEWYEWCDNEYPGTTQSRDWEDIATAAGKDVDIRLLIRGHSIAGYSILLFLEACYAVDKALCGTDIEALAKVKMWHMPQEMRAYSYLLSTEMILWWATELAELENEIKSTFSSRVSVSWRVKDLSRCLAKFDVVMEGRGGIGTNIWTTMEETVTGIGPPVGVDDAIYDRVERLRSSVKILRKILERSEQGDVALNTLPLVNQNSTDPGG